MTYERMVRQYVEMNADDLLSLTDRQREALIIAMHVRNTLEDFHVAHLSDPQMKELNQLVRFGIYEALGVIETVSQDPHSARQYAFLAMLIPDYWEIPGRDPDPTGRPGL